jgi:hypothetical protein
VFARFHNEMAEQEEISSDDSSDDESDDKNVSQFSEE